MFVYVSHVYACVCVCVNVLYVKMQNSDNQ